MTLVGKFASLAGNLFSLVPGFFLPTHLGYFQQQSVFLSAGLGPHLHLELLGQLDDVPQEGGVRGLHAVDDPPGGELSRNDGPHLAEEHLELGLRGAVERLCQASGPIGKAL